MASSEAALGLSTAKAELISRLSQLLGRNAEGKDFVYRADHTREGMFVCELTLLEGGLIYKGEPCNTRKRAEQSAALAAVQSGDLGNAPQASSAPASVNADLNCHTEPPAKRLKRSSSDVRVCGPASIQTLRGCLFGREVALVCCGEAHENVIDLTRENCIIAPKRGWVKEDSYGEFARMDPVLSAATKNRTTLAEAKKWAEKIIKEDREESAWHDSWLSFDTNDFSDGSGTARVFASGAASRYHGVSAATPETAMQLFRWADLDNDARKLANRRRAGDHVPLEDLDALIAGRKDARKAEGVVLFDDWLIQQSQAGTQRVVFVLEAPVSASEVELHEEPNLGPAPPAKECHRLVELDSDTDSDEDDPEDKHGSFLDYLERRARQALNPDQFYCVDPRELGDAWDENSQDLSLQVPESEKTLQDLEERELEACGAEEATHSTGHVHPGRPRHRRGRAGRLAKHEDQRSDGESVPSWEAFFGAAAELLYYSPHVKADYAHFLAGCVGTAKNMREFFLSLFFQTIPEALALLKLDEETRPLARIRSLAYQAHPGAKLQRRPIGQGLVPIRTAPLHRYLKAKGFDPPRLWVSGVAERLRNVPGGAQIVNAAKEWFLRSTNKLLADPRNSDTSGDYFMAWLRACHRGVYRDVDRTDAAKLRKKQNVQSESRPDSRLHRFDLTQVKIPSLDRGFQELKQTLNQTNVRACTPRERTLAQIFVDGFQLRLVDLATILTVANAVQSAPAGEQPIVVVIYAGSDHVQSVVDFWRSHGFSEEGLEPYAYIGKEDWEEEDPRALLLPDFLADFSLLFPVPGAR
eukprot:TRINITY_DN39553_c0_g1_i1.p1 TRINITY_DN39553_c0_g1~~TRINITY_DN39553_c0_g1_i1.p1  ORF type:complete len:821 (+),score=156.39 TRINITY_DN39553_c0_g1_i1:32-2464(+)